MFWESSSVPSRASEFAEARPQMSKIHRVNRVAAIGGGKNSSRKQGKETLAGQNSREESSGEAGGLAFGIGDDGDRSSETNTDNRRGRRAMLR